MLDIGFSEILLTSVIALVVLGPERLPKVAKQVGNWIGRARAMARQLSDQLDREVAAADLTKMDRPKTPDPPRQAEAPHAEPPYAPPHAEAQHAEERRAESSANPVTSTDTAESPKPPHE